MLNRIKLTNFRKHTSTDLSLHTGLMVLRGANEAGKSSVLEAIAYAIGGVKVLRSPLEDVVTYGEALNTLKVELWLSVDGVEYYVKRGKSGAEVAYDGGRVTGQTECTSFLYAKLGVEPAAATRLMFANQGQIRGALDAGPKATTELIERLAEFDQIDKVIDLIQENKALGSPATQEAALSQAQERLANLGDAGEPDYVSLQGQIDTAREAEASAKGAVTVVEAEVAAAQKNLDSERSRAADADRVQRSVSASQQRLQRISQDLQDAHRETNMLVAVRTPAEVQADIDAVGDGPRHLQAWARLSRYVGQPDGSERFSGSLAKLKETIRSDEAEISHIRDTVAKAKRDKAVAEAGLTNGSCGFCGQDFSEVPAVIEKNAKEQSRIADLAASISASERLRAELDASHARLTAILNASSGVLQAVDANPDYLKVEGAVLPPTVAWIGPVIDDLKGADQRLAQLQIELKEANAEVSRRAGAEARYSTLLTQRQTAEAELQGLNDELDMLPPHDVTGAEAEKEAVLERRRPLQVSVTDAQDKVRSAEYALRDARRDHERALEQRQALQAEVDRRTAEIKDITFNNALIKRVRQCRPLIADKLWTIVLSAVASYFSEMRGEKSTVVKDSDGFKVDGHSVDSLSGSTLDILGLATRTALVRTFLPAAPFMVLDEPCAAMDAQRTENTLGFIVASGFKQVLLVTHEDTSETVADHLVHI